MSCLALALAWSACARAQPARCDIGPANAAARNAVSLETLAWSPFGRSETGWAIYEPLIAREIGAACPPASPAFAGALARWQTRVGLPGSGIIDVASFSRLKRIWQDRRPFVAASHLACPAPPAETSLARARVTESYGGKAIWLRPRALGAYRAMIASARAQSPAVAADPRLLTIFSAYRSPAYDDARCAREANCQGVVRASCSAHRTGLAVDLFLGAAPGFGPDASADSNRLAISQGPAYAWLVRNADRFGFVNYPFEPWHWEWVGEKP
ncbi:MAG TPA: D-alanyl-D-alanine carboxypeptidase family protein [Caulobacteraceae bacterium]